jgi:hypothetical protein
MDLAVGYLAAYQESSQVFHGPAQGRVRVPADAIVHLSLHTPIRGLGSLAPDDVYGIVVPKQTTTDTDLSHLAHLTGLRDLHCSKARPVTDQGLAHLARLRRLRKLDLYQTGVTDAGLVHVAGMVLIERLHLGGTRVQGAGLRYLAWLRRLEWLSLECTDVDDAVVPHLLALGSLRKIALWGTRLSTKGLAALRSGLPAAQIVARDPGRRLAAERSRRALTEILAHRLRPQLPHDASAQTASGTLLPPGCQILAFRVGGRIHAFKRAADLADFDIVSRWLGLLPLGCDLHVVAPGGLDVWIPWLRPRRRGRRRIEPRPTAPTPAAGGSR